MIEHRFAEFETLCRSFHTHPEIVPAVEPMPTTITKRTGQLGVAKEFEAMRMWKFHSIKERKAEGSRLLTYLL